MNKLCTNAGIFLQRTLLRHAGTRQNAWVFNCHVPSTAGTERRKKDVVRKLMDLGNEAHGSGVAQPAAAWIVGGDMNLSHSQLVSLCSWFVKPSKPCFSKSGMPPTRDAHKSDIAISQGIALVHVPAWVGVHFRPCVSDAHDMVLVAGALEGMQLLPWQRSKLSQEEMIKMFEKQKEFALKEIERLTQENAETQRVIKENRIAQLRQKTDVVQKLMEDANEAQGSGVAQPAAAWIVGGDMNLSEGQLVSLCSSFVKPFQAMLLQERHATNKGRAKV